MANLIIKPAPGSGNKVVFQNQAGTVDAITVEDSGNTTFAGTANNLGTVTAGSIAGGAITSATTFPAGHVLNTHFDRPTAPYVTHLSASWSATLLSSAYTFKHVNSSLMVLGHISWARITSAQFWINCRIVRSGTTKMEIGSYGGSNDYGIHPTCNFADSGTHAVDDVWTYELSIKSDSSNTVGINQIPDTGYKTSFTFFEIAT